MNRLYSTALFATVVTIIFGVLAGIDIFFVACIMGILILSVAKIVHKTHYHTKGRQIFHLLAGIILVYVIKIFGMTSGLVLCIVGIFLGSIFSEMILRKMNVPILLYFVDNFERKGIRPLKGLLYYGLGALLTIILFSNNTNAVLAGILAVGFVDSYATGFGTMFGKIEIIKGRSIEGIIAGFLACYFVCWTFLPATLAFTVAIVGSVIDFASLPIDDNLTIPLIAATAVAFL